MNSISRFSTLSLRRQPNLYVNSKASIFRRENFKLCMFSTSSKDQMIKFLYRQGLRWCKYNQSDVNISQFIETKVFEPPIIDASALHRLINQEDCLIRKWLPNRSVVKENQVLTSIQTVSEIRNLWRAIFQLNKDDRNDELKVQARISSAFLALKELNNLSGILQDIDAARKRHIDREGVKFEIGQVVQHKEYKWRGIIAGWEKTTMPAIPDLEPAKLNFDNSVLTHKDQIDDDETIWYAVIKDSGDATLMRKESECQFPDLNISKDGSRPHQLPLYRQSDLVLVQDASLCRIRSGETAAFFDGFDSRRGCFTPNAAIKHKYPFDNGNMWTEHGTENSLNATEIFKMAKDITQAVQLFARRLENKIIESISINSGVRSTMLTNLQVTLSRLSNGDIISESESLEKDSSALNLASLHLKELRRCSVQLSELLTLRHFGLASRNEIEFRLGDVVEHKVYGYRGIVVGWDATPVTDMSNWYATFGVDSPNERPYYRVQPDTSDCIKVFGRERPLQYICQDNLELCPLDSTFLDVDTKWKRDALHSRYIPDDETKFSHGEDLNDNGITEKCLFDLYTDFNALKLSQRNFTNQGDTELKEIGRVLSTDALRVLLKAVNDMDSAFWISEAIKASWKGHPDIALRIRLDHGIAHLLNKQKVKALETFQDLIKEDPQYGEAWNLLATCYFMSDQKDLSQEAAKAALSVIPEHFQAMSALGLIQSQEHEDDLAAMTFRRILELDPWSQVSTKLTECIKPKIAHEEDLDEVKEL